MAKRHPRKQDENCFRPFFPFTGTSKHVLTRSYNALYCAGLHEQCPEVLDMSVLTSRHCKPKRRYNVLRSSLIANKNVCRHRSWIWLQMMGSTQWEADTIVAVLNPSLTSARQR